MTAQGYYSDTVGQGGPDVEEELLDFDRAMRDFQQMFPNVSPAHIEYVLRKYDGDVSATINELLYDNTPSTPTSSSYFLRGEDALTRLRRRRHEINEKLNENQRFLDRVTDVETARTYEDQQLALLLEHREVNTLISEEKAKKSHDSVSTRPPQLARRHVKIPKNSRKTDNFLRKNTEKSTENIQKKSKIVERRRSEEERVPDGPLIGIEEKSENFTTKLKETLKKGKFSNNFFDFLLSFRGFSGKIEEKRLKIMEKK
ncbi:hypothetical protein CRE_12230 [Caenorhabditis remanei]|uniref:CUE domain-containing protein n=1 Tax=Caenorhabditis remanei TaxID=31234 RepID=E3N6Z2_CAERE|nr:hypothetical protein CRE_12230 [Caenorhabditis remanei]